MVMGYFNRFLLLLYALAIALASLGVAALCLRIVPASVVLNEAAFLLSRWETIVGALVVFLWSVHLMGCSLSGSAKGAGDKEVLVVHGSAGEVRVAVPAVRDMVEKSALRVSGVSEAKAKIHISHQGEKRVVEVALQVAIEGTQSIAVVSDNIRGALGQQMSGVLGIKDFKLEIAVSDFGQLGEDKKRVS